jgi:signal transduction histidine kinase
VDIPRAPVKRGRQQLLYGGLTLAAIVLATLGLHGLKPAAPRVDRAAVWIDSVQRGPLVIEVRGPGTLVPERIRYISAVTAGRVERRLAEAGEEVRPETVLLELSNPDVQLEALESERQLTVSRAEQVNLHADLASQRLTQEAQVATARAAYLDAKRNAEAAESLAAKQLISANEASRTRDKATFAGGAGRWEVRGTTFRQDGRPHRLLVLADLSRVLRAEERSALQRIVRVLGHEINNSLAPIKSIAGSLRSIAERPARPADWEQDLRAGLQVIEGRSESLARFMGAYAQLARLPRPTLAAVRIDEWVRRVAALETRLEVMVQDGPRVVLTADGDQLDQLLMNLVRNAADAALETGGGVHVGWRVLSGVAEVTVDDDGPGLPDPGNLFVPFFTTKSNGTGIGLVLSRQIADAHGGSVVLEPRPGGVRGARACLRLPLGPLTPTADS